MIIAWNFTSKLEFGNTSQRKMKEKRRVENNIMETKQKFMHIELKI